MALQDATPTAKGGSDISTPEPFDEEALPESTPSLEAATRLIDPMRLNNLTPEEITPRHLRKANRTVKRVSHQLFGIQQAAHRLLLAARDEAQRGQQLARTDANQRRARRVQGAIRRHNDLHAHFDALEDEFRRHARKVAAARDLLQAWEQEKVGMARRGGAGVARALRQTTLNLARLERVTNDRLEETRRALVHVNVAEEAMRRDADMTRLDPVNFARFAGRSKWRVRLAVAFAVIALVAVIYPPWSPPHLALSCTIPVGNQRGCDTVHATSNVRVVNQGSGVMVGWAVITVNGANGNSSQVIPLVLLPHSSRALSCSDYGNCATEGGSAVKVQITTSGGSSDVSVVP